MIRTGIVILLLSHALMTVAQQSQPFVTEVFGTRDGLVSPFIYRVMQDSRHYLWVGTKIGASRFNGYEFENFQFTARQQQVGKIVALAEDNRHRIWLGGEKGLFCFQHDSIIEAAFMATGTAEVEDLICDAQGNLYVGSAEGLYMIPAGAAVGSSLQAIAPAGLRKTRITALTLDRSGLLYLGTYTGIYTWNGSGMPRLIWKNPDESDFVHSIAASSSDNLLWTTREAHAWQMVDGLASPAFGGAYLARSFFIHDHHVYGLLFNSLVEITDGMPHELFDLNALTNFPADVLVDAEGNKWVGTWEGLFKFRDNPFHVFSQGQSAHPEIFSMLERQDGALWFGGNRGILFTRQGNEIIPITSIVQPVVPQAEVLCMFEDADGSTWFGSGYNGISHLSGDHLIRYSEDDSLADNSCYAFLKASNGRLFACTGKGVVEIVRQANRPSFIHCAFEEKYSRAPELYGGFEDRSGRLCFYGSQGIYALEQHRLHHETIAGFPFTTFNVKHIIRDRKSQVWIATQGNGLLLCNENAGGFALQKQLTKKDGLPSEVVLSVLMDKNGDIWVSDFTGITFIRNNGSLKMYSFNEHDGLLSNYYQDLKLSQQRNGTIWGLSTLGTFSFHPDSIPSNAIPPVMQLDPPLLFEGKYDLSAYASSHNGIQWQLPYNRNSLSFNYTAISITEASKNQYAYRLVGLDSEWNYTRRRSVDFNYLPPGNYRFEVMGSNNSDVWSPPLSQTFSISLPFWQTWWFKALLFLSGAALMFLLWRETEKRRQRKRILQEKDSKLTELKRAMNEARLMAIRAQMNPHFIFNCMSAIQKLIITRDEENASLYLTRFSKLLRMVMEHSGKNLIPLDEDVEVNRLYLELESLRFKKEIQFSVMVDEALEDEDVLLPGLLVQPFLENALLHGLLNKQGEKKIELRYFIRDEYLCCEIADNGVGRKKAGEIKSQRLGGHYESKAIQLSAQRIELLNQQTGSRSSIHIADETDAGGTATGTTVTILLPLHLMNASAAG